MKTIDELNEMNDAILIDHCTIHEVRSYSFICITDAKSFQNDTDSNVVVSKLEGDIYVVYNEQTSFGQFLCDIYDNLEDAVECQKDVVESLIDQCKELSLENSDGDNDDYDGRYHYYGWSETDTERITNHFNR